MNSFARVYAFFLGILFFSIVFILFPPEGKQKRQRNNEEVATLEVNDFTLFSVANNLPEAKVIGKKGLQFEDREEFWDFSLTNYNPEIGGLKSLKARENEETFYVFHGIKKNDRYLFDGGIKYSNLDGVEFEAQKGVFYLQNRIFQTEGEFWMKTQEGEFAGNDLFYDAKKQMMRANLPRGKIWFEEQ